MSSIVIFKDDNLSRLWARSFYYSMEPRISEISPLLISLDVRKDSIPDEIPEIRDALDQSLLTNGFSKCSTVAETIFPLSLWNQERERELLYKRYKVIFKYIKKCSENKYGVYFARLIAYESEGPNQLNNIIKFYLSGNHRRSAFQASIFNPKEDQTNQRRRGFPCLQHVIFTPDGNDGLEITAFYATQQLFDKAYGNYLGLCFLGIFMAHEMGLTLKKMNCISCVAIPKPTKLRKESLQKVIELCKSFYIEPDLV